MAKTEEAKVRDPVIDYAHKRGVRTIRMYFGPGIQTGWPDDLFLLPGGRPLLIEFKAPGEEPTKKQQIKIDLLEEFGYAVEVCDNKEEGKKLIDEYLYAIGSGNF